jgi:cysteinyl-tRNA synthetase
MKESWDMLERWYDIAEPLAGRRIGDGLLSALHDDLNTPLALTGMHQSTDEEVAGGLALLGFSANPERIAAKSPVDPSEIARAIAARDAARKAHDFREADRIRAGLEGKGILLKDNSDGTTTWEVKR